MATRTLLCTPDGGTLGLDETPLAKDASALTPETPIVVVQHGLTGGSYEAYIRAILSHACAPKNQGGLGFRAIIINFRGCMPTFLIFCSSRLTKYCVAGANVPITSPQVQILGLSIG